MQETTFYLQRSGLGVFDKVARLRSPTGILEHLSKEASLEARSAPKVGSFSDVNVGGLGGRRPDVCGL